MARIYYLVVKTTTWLSSFLKTNDNPLQNFRLARSYRGRVYVRWRPAGNRSDLCALRQPCGELINEDKIILGGEESAGLSIKGHYPEKDGILACLLAAEAVAARGASLTEQLEAPYERTGRLEYGRIGVRLTAQVMQSLQDRLKEDPSEIGGHTHSANKSN